MTREAINAIADSLDAEDAADSLEDLTEISAFLTREQGTVISHAEDTAREITFSELEG